MQYEQEIITVCEKLKAGEIILYPTDTVWGIGCDATNITAVSKIYKIKKRKNTKSLVILVSTEQMLKNYVDEIPTKAKELILTYEKPLTIIYTKAKKIAANAIAKDGSIAIRLVRDKFCQEIINKFGKPIVSTSANISGQATPANFVEISEEIKNQVDYIVKYRQTDKKETKPSTIVKLESNGEIIFLRK
jgi:L-threonylcarbamoyladenylate synthase